MGTATITTTPERVPTMFEYEFMLNAFAASGIVAVLAGVVGYFLVLRGQTFAGHALSHVGFTGATGAFTCHHGSRIKIHAIPLGKDS